MPEPVAVFEAVTEPGLAPELTTQNAGHGVSQRVPVPVWLWPGMRALRNFW